MDPASEYKEAGREDCFMADLGTGAAMTEGALVDFFFLIGVAARALSSSVFGGGHTMDGL